jgi:hypothetical protein
MVTVGNEPTLYKRGDFPIPLPAITGYWCPILLVVHIALIGILNLVISFTPLNCGTKNLKEKFHFFSCRPSVLQPVTGSFKALLGAPTGHYFRALLYANVSTPSYCCSNFLSHAHIDS